MVLPLSLKRAGLVLLAGVAVLALAYLAARNSARPAPARPWFAARPGDHHPLVFAHQGGENLWPSNTMLAFRNAAQMGADVLDTDMHMTKDGALVLMHDDTVDRTTDGSGAIRDYTLADLKKLDAGYKFTPDEGQTFPFRGQGVTVPTVEELFQAFPDKRFGIEIKPNEPAAIVGRFCDVIRQYGMQDKVLVSSDPQPNMDAFRKACPEVATSATRNEILAFLALSNLGLVDVLSPRYDSLQVPETSGILTILTPQFVEAAHRRGLAVQPWTIDETADMERVLALGVDGINTDNPDRLLQLVK